MNGGRNRRSGNYPIVRAKTREKQIVAVYMDAVVKIVDATAKIDIVNGKRSREIVLSIDRDLGAYRFDVRDCQGRAIESGERRLAKGLASFDVPPSGLLTLERR